MTLKHKQMSFDIKSFDADTGCFEGYANVFDFRDYAGDITQPGAFTKSLKLHKDKNSMPALLWQHKMEQPIGVWTEMYEDEHGLYAKGQLALGVQQADEAYILMKMGALSGLSIGYITTKERYDREQKANLLQELMLLETSLVTMPCSDISRVEVVKSRLEQEELPTEREMEKALRELGLSRKQSKAFLAEGYKSLAANDDEIKAPVIELNNTVSTKEASELLDLINKLA